MISREMWIGVGLFVWISVFVGRRRRGGGVVGSAPLASGYLGSGSGRGRVGTRVRDGGTGIGIHERGWWWVRVSVVFCQDVHQAAVFGAGFEWKGVLGDCRGVAVPRTGWWGGVVVLISFTQSGGRGRAGGGGAAELSRDSGEGGRAGADGSRWRHPEL